MIKYVLEIIHSFLSKVYLPYTWPKKKKKKRICLILVVAIPELEVEMLYSYRSTHLYRDSYVSLGLVWSGMQ